MKKILILILLVLFCVDSFSQRKKRKRVSKRNNNIVQTIPEVVEPVKEVNVYKRKVAIARFSNETKYAKGIFYSKENDPMAKQALDILSTKLASSGKFILLERGDFDKIQAEMEIADSENYQKIGADYLIIGSITEFGRKNVGHSRVFSREKTQIVQAGVSVRLIDVSTGEIIYSEESKGEAQTANKTTLGLGERTDYDATLSDKAISAAISQLVENIINNCMERPWKTYFLDAESDIIMTGGSSQGIKVGDIFDVVAKGRKVKNPQTGMLVELPGKKVGQIQIDVMFGDTPQSEMSIVSFISGSINPNDLNKYVIKEIVK